MTQGGFQARSLDPHQGQCAKQQHTHAAAAAEERLSHDVLRPDWCNVRSMAASFGAASVRSTDMQAKGTGEAASAPGVSLRVTCLRMTSPSKCQPQDCAIACLSVAEDAGIATMLFQATMSCDGFSQMEEDCSRQIFSAQQCGAASPSAAVDPQEVCLPERMYGEFRKKNPTRCRT
jgi:hypothetical protein